jgi:hypothetical protein
MQHRPDPTSRATWEGLLRPFADPEPTVEPPIHPFGSDDPAVAAWSWCLGSGDLKAFRELSGRRRGGEGPRPLLATRDDLAIEVWTECELTVLHAGFRRLLESEARGPAAPVALVERHRRDLQDAVAWHLEHTQPDNATTHPWGLHAVLELGSPTAEAIDHAGSMLHAMQAAAVMTPDGRPDPLSRWIAADLVRTLSSLGPGPIGGRC